MKIKKLLLGILIGVFAFPTITLGGTFVVSLIQGKTAEEAVQILAEQIDSLIGRMNIIEVEQAEQKEFVEELEIEQIGQKELTKEIQEQYFDKESSFCNNLSFFSDEDFYNYKGQVAGYLFQSNGEELKNYSIEKRLEMSGLSKKGRIGDIIMFNNLIACGYFEGINSYIVLENVEEKTPFVVVDSNMFQMEGGGGDLYVDSFSPKGDYLIYKRQGYEEQSAKIYDISNKKIIFNFIGSLDSYDFTPDRKYFYACGGTDFGDFLRYGLVFDVSGFILLYDLVKEFNFGEYYSIDCYYDDESNSIIYSVEEENQKRFFEYMLDNRTGMEKL